MLIVKNYQVKGSVMYNIVDYNIWQSRLLPRKGRASLEVSFQGATLPCLLL